MSGSSAGSANTGMSVFSLSGTTSAGENNADVATLLAAMSPDEALNVLLRQLPGPGAPAGMSAQGGQLTAGNALTAGGHLPSLNDVQMGHQCRGARKDKALNLTQTVSMKNGHYPNLPRSARIVCAVNTAVCISS